MLFFGRIFVFFLILITLLPLSFICFVSFLRFASLFCVVYVYVYVYVTLLWSVFFFCCGVCIALILFIYFLFWHFQKIDTLLCFPIHFLLISTFLHQLNNFVCLLLLLLGVLFYCFFYFLFSPIQLLYLLIKWRTKMARGRTQSQWRWLSRDEKWGRKSKAIGISNRIVYGVAWHLFWLGFRGNE